MKKIILILAILTINIMQSYTQWTPDWTSTYSRTSSSADGITHMKVKGGYIYVTGYSYNSSNNAIVTIKYNSSGSQVWSSPAVYTSTHLIVPNGIDIDSHDNVYIVGTENNGTDNDYVTIKYNSSGTFQWAEYYDNGGNDEAGAIGVNKDGDIFVTGGSVDVNTSIMNIYTIKYNSSGTEQSFSGHNRFIHPLFPLNPEGKAWSIAFDENSASNNPGYGLYVSGWYHNVSRYGDWHHDAQIVHYRFDGSYKNDTIDEVRYQVKIGQIKL